MQGIYEEFAKSVGYQGFSTEIPVGLGVLADPLLYKKENVEAILLGEVFFEVFTNGFYSEQHWERMPIEDYSPNWGHVKLQNALTVCQSLIDSRWPAVCGLHPDRRAGIFSYFPPPAT